MSLSFSTVTYQIATTLVMITAIVGTVMLVRSLGVLRSIRTRDQP
jgi:hypothetical protein